MSKVSIASIVVALGLCSGGPALASQAADDKAWAAAQVGEDSGSFYLSQQVWASTRKRAEVRQEVLAARRSGELNVLCGEDSGSFHLSRSEAQGAVSHAGAERGVEPPTRAAAAPAPAAR